jgi:hypothetical protein
MASPIPARIIQVLQDYLPAELNLIDTEEGNDFATPDISNGDYFQWERAEITSFPAFTMRLQQFDPIEARATEFGGRLHANYRAECMVHVTLGVSTANPLRLQQLCYRYMAGVYRVLLIAHNGLDTVADPVRWGTPTATTVVEPAGTVQLGPGQQQESGAIVRTVTVPVNVRRIEAR